MGLRTPTPMELEAVRAALDQFREHWVATRPLFPCPFEGTIEDIHALDYLDYEGLSYPPCGMAGASLVWGNVIATQLPFQWCFDEEIGGLVLHYRLGTVIFWPFGRVYESQKGFEFQFKKYRWLLARVTVQIVRDHPCLEPEELKRLRAILADDESQFVPVLEYSLAQLRELRGPASGCQDTP